MIASDTITHDLTPFNCMERTASPLCLQLFQLHQSSPYLPGPLHPYLDSMLQLAMAMQPSPMQQATVTEQMACVCLLPSASTKWMH